MDYLSMNGPKGASFCAMTLSVLGPTEADTVLTFMRLLAEALDSLDGTWCESPYVVVAGLHFQMRAKVIPVVEVYYILNRPFQDGSYKTVPSQEDPGYYNYYRTTIKFRLRSSTYRKKAEKLLLDQLHKIIRNQNSDLPDEICKMSLMETSSSLTVLFRFQNSNCVAIALVPAIAGTDIPDGTNIFLVDQCEETWEESGGGPKWFLIPPPYNSRLNPYSWELGFPFACDLVDDFHRLAAATLLLTYVAEVRRWTKMGLQFPHNAILACALSMGPNHISLISTAPLLEQLGVLLERLITAIQNGELNDFCIPGRNYLAGMSKGQRVQLELELKKGFEHLTTLDRFLEEYVGEVFPMPLPKCDRFNEQTKTKERASSGKSTEMSTDADYLSPETLVKEIEAQEKDGLTRQQQQPVNSNYFDAVPEVDRARANCVDETKTNVVAETRKKVVVCSDRPHHLVISRSVLIVMAVVVLGVWFTMALSEYFDFRTTLPWASSRNLFIEVDSCDSEDDDDDDDWDDWTPRK